MKIIAVTNIKGGVGKTTTTAILAYLHAAAGLTYAALWAEIDARLGSPPKVAVATAVADPVEETVVDAVADVVTDATTLDHFLTGQT